MHKGINQSFRSVCLSVCPHKSCQMQSSRQHCRGEIHPKCWKTSCSFLPCWRYKLFKSLVFVLASMIAPTDHTPMYHAHMHCQQWCRQSQCSHTWLVKHQCCVARMHIYSGLSNYCSQDEWITLHEPPLTIVYGWGSFFHSSSEQVCVGGGLAHVLVMHSCELAQLHGGRGLSISGPWLVVGVCSCL